MRARCRVPPGADILTHVDTQPDKDVLHSIIEEEEALGLARMQLQPGAHELLAALAAARVPAALLTRNNDVAMEKVTALLPPFAVRLTRSFVPCKPHPAPVHHICERLGVGVDECVVVGDSIDDIACGKAAGSLTIYVGPPNGETGDLRAHEQADHSVETLAEVRSLIRFIETDEIRVA